MRYFLDTEFDQTGGPEEPVPLLSIAIVAESRAEFYAIHEDAIYAVEDKNLQHRWEAMGSGHSHEDSWLVRNVIPVLDGPLDPPYRLDPHETRMPLRRIRQGIEDFMVETRGFESCEFWATHGATDWFLFTRLWGTFAGMPHYLPKWFYELKQYQRFLGVPTLPAALQPEHNALADARSVKKDWEHLAGPDPSRQGDLAVSWIMAQPPLTNEIIKTSYVAGAGPTLANRALAESAGFVLPIFEKFYPGDRRPRNVIDAIHAWARGEASKGDVGRAQRSLVHRRGRPTSYRPCQR